MANWWQRLFFTPVRGVQDDFFFVVIEPTDRNPSFNHHLVLFPISVKILKNVHKERQQKKKSRSLWKPV